MVVPGRYNKAGKYLLRIFDVTLKALQSLSCLFQIAMLNKASLSLFRQPTCQMPNHTYFDTKYHGIIPENLQYHSVMSLFNFNVLKKSTEECVYIFKLST